MKAGHLTPMLQVSDVARSIRFYTKLGFELVDVMGQGWARMHCEGGALMLLASDGLEAPPDGRLMLYLYTPDLPAFRRELLAGGIDVSAIHHPDHLPGGEMSMKDPDGYDVFVGHWDDKAQETWNREREQKRAAGLIP